MKIDRHNYEEFFLLYIDNELSVDQKKQVEAFVGANPDLEEEFVMLQQSKLVADNSIVFEGKESLMRESDVNMANYEEWLLLYVDNELTTEQKLLVEKFAAAHPHVKEELDLFLQTKLEPQEIVFADKASLYREEEKVRVISMSWWRIAVAAVLILAAGFGTYSVINNKAKTADTADVKNNIPGKSTQPQQTVRPEQSPVNTEVETTQQTAEVKNEKIENVVATKIDAKQNKIKKDQQELPQQKNIVNETVIAKVDQQPVNEKQKEDAIVTPETITSNPDKAIVAAIDNDPKSVEPFNKPGVTKPDAKTPDYSKAKMLTSFDETASNDENKKLRGFFRKAARFIERTTKVNPANDDNKVLIGSMAVSLK